jgi:NAD(P)-dependent dehydrogenase (short-subunit alcohol dehydrogenase family)
LQKLSSGEGACVPDKRTAIVTGASGGIGSGLVEAFLKEGYNVVGTSLKATRSLSASPSLVLVDGDIGKQDKTHDNVFTCHAPTPQ